MLLDSNVTSFIASHAPLRACVDPVNFDPEWTVCTVTDHHTKLGREIRTERFCVYGAAKDFGIQIRERHPNRLPVRRVGEIDRPLLGNPAVTRRQAVFKDELVGTPVGTGTHNQFRKPYQSIDPKPDPH